MKRLLHALLIFSLWLPVPSFGASEAPGEFGASAKSALESGLTYLRIHFVASDEELPGIRQAIHEGEHAVEPPTHVEGFWARRWEVLRHPLVALDLRRSFQNVRRLMRVSHSFANSGARDLLLSSATMFGITHGGEFATGTAKGVEHGAKAAYHLLAGDTATAAAEAGLALSWWGLALPGFYDFGCWIGQGALLIRPTRNAFHSARKFTVQMAGKAGHALGLPAVMRAIFEYRPARAKILEALENGGAAVSFEVTMRDEDLLKFQFVRDELPVFDLQFEENAAGELILRKASIEAHELKALTYAELKEALGVFGWNVLGVFRQFRKLLIRDHADLIAAEETFVAGVEWKNAHRFDVEFRDSAVYVKPERRIHPHLRKECAESLALAAQAKM